MVKRLAILLVILACTSSIADEDEDDILLSKILRKAPAREQFRKDSVDEASLETRAVFQEFQRRRIRTADRDGKEQVWLILRNASLNESSKEWEVVSEKAFYKNAYGVIAGCTPEKLSRRIVRDHFASELDCRDLVEATEKAMHNLFHRGSATNIAACHKQSQERLGVKGAALFEFLLHKTKLQLMRDYNLSELYTSGALLTRLIADPPKDKWEMDQNHVYWNAHVDKANIPTYDYSALLYLNDFGIDFAGGEFAFIDDDADRIVEPRAGRLLTFTSGPENLHRARKVTRGKRYVLAMWFTCSELHQYKDDEPKSAHPAAEQQLIALHSMNQDLISANDLLLRASEKLRIENEQLRTIGKLCLASGALDGTLGGNKAPPAVGRKRIGDSTSTSGGGDGGGNRKAAEQGQLLQQMALDRRLAAEEEFAQRRLEAARKQAKDAGWTRDAGSAGGGDLGGGAGGGGGGGGRCYDVESCSASGGPEDFADGEEGEGDGDGDDPADTVSFGRDQ